METSSENSNRRGYALVIVLALLTILPYLLNAGDGLVSDDWVAFHMLRGQPAGQVLTGENLAGAATYRPLTSLLFWLEANVFGHRPAVFRLVNLLFGFLVALALVGLFRRLFDRRIALLTLTAFALAPAHAENLAWISGRAEVLATLLLLTGLLLHVGWRQQQRTWALVSSFVCYFLAMAANETAVIVPLLLLLVDRHVDERPTWKSTGALAAGSAALAGTWLSLVYLLTGSVGLYRQFGLYAVRDLIRFVQLYFFPFNLDAAIPWVMAHEWAVFAPAVVILLGLAVLGRRICLRPAVRLGLLGGLVALLPVAGMYPRGLLLFLPGAWFALAVGGVVDELLKRDNRAIKTATVVAFALWLAACGFFSVYQARLWSQSADLAGQIVQDLAEIEFPEDEDTTLLALTVPDTLHGAFVMRNGLHQAVRTLQPKADVVVHTLLLAGLADATGNVNVEISPDGAFVVNHQGQSIYDYLLPPDASLDLRVDDHRVIGPAGYLALNKRPPFNLTAMEVSVDRKLLAQEQTMVYFYKDGRMQLLKIKGELP